MAGEENASLSSPVELCTGLRKGAACYKQDALETESKRGCRGRQSARRVRHRADLWEILWRALVLLLLLLLETGRSPTCDHD